jgi:hypothetical protein
MDIFTVALNGLDQVPQDCSLNITYGTFLRISLKKEILFALVKVMAFIDFHRNRLTLSFQYLHLSLSNHSNPLVTTLLKNSPEPTGIHRLIFLKDEFIEFFLGISMRLSEVWRLF